MCDVCAVLEKFHAIQMANFSLKLTEDVLNHSKYTYYDAQCEFQLFSGLKRISTMSCVVYFILCVRNIVRELEHSTESYVLN